MVEVFRRKVRVAWLEGEGKGEVSWCGVNGIIVDVQEMERAREVVAILLNDVWYIGVGKSGRVSSRILCIKFK